MPNPDLLCATRLGRKRHNGLLKAANNMQKPLFSLMTLRNESILKVWEQKWYLMNNKGLASLIQILLSSTDEGNKGPSANRV